MIISEITLKNFKSFGNNEQTLKLNTNSGELILLAGSNGNGKSVIPSTNIQVEIPLEYFSLHDFIIFLEAMDVESTSYILYIKEKNIKLYEEYIEYINK
jgi:predicted ATP-dependent endonuclease of OLD family